MDLYATTGECAEMKENAGQKVMSESQYPSWEKKLGSILQNRYGIGLVDCLDQVELISSFRNGESPVEVADDLERNRGLTDLNDL
jgi:hypothetical protein